MTEPNSHCPYLGLKQNRAIRFAAPTPEHRCFVSGEPLEIPVDQASYCLAQGHVHCPLYMGLTVPTTNDAPTPFGGIATAGGALVAPTGGMRGWLGTLSPAVPARRLDQRRTADERDRHRYRAGHPAHCRPTDRQHESNKLDRRRASRDSRAADANRSTDRRALANAYGRADQAAFDSTADQPADAAAYRCARDGCRSRDCRPANREACHQRAKANCCAQSDQRAQTNRRT